MAASRLIDELPLLIQPRECGPVSAIQRDLPVAEDGSPIPGSFVLTVLPDSHDLVAADAAATRYALESLRRLREAGIADITLRDWPTLPTRGVIEGFYGEPWTHEQRLHHLAEAGRWRFTHYAYAPKDDALHRAKWREHYSPEAGALIAELASVGAAGGVEFVYALHPGLDMVHSHDSDHEALAAKVRSLHALGVRRFAVLFDDIPLELSHSDDIARFGSGAMAAGRAHGLTCARLMTEVLSSLELTGPLIMVPTDYAGCGATDYRVGLDETLPANVAIWWTGSDIVVGEVTADDAAAAYEAFGRRELLLWDNFPVNDFDRSRAFLGPLLGRAADLPSAGIAGIFANPMVEYEPSRFALASVAQWAWNPEQYDPTTAAARALHEVAAAAAARLAPLIAAASSWPPSAAQYPLLAELLEHERRSPGNARLDEIVHDLQTLDATGWPALQPWATAGRATGEALALAIAQHRHASAEPVAEAWARVLALPAQLARDAAAPFIEHVIG